MLNRRSLLSYTGAATLGALIGRNSLPLEPFSISKFGYLPSLQATKRFETRDRWRASDFDGDIVGNGKNKVIRLWKLWERAAGTPFEPHKQTIGDCFVAGTKVRMADGSERCIETVAVGDYVLTPMGNTQRVVSTISRDYVGDLVTLSGHSYARKLVCTPDHRLWDGADWTPAESASRVLVPYTPTIGTDVVLDMLDIDPKLAGGNPRHKQPTQGFVRAKGTQHEFPRFITLTEDLGWLIGLYAAEGGVDNNRVTLNLSHEEWDYAQRAIDILATLGVTAKAYIVPSKPTVLYVRWTSAGFARLITYLVPGNQWSKELHPCLYGTSTHIRYALLRGWFDGDGHLRNTQSRFKATATSVSPQLVYDYAYIVGSLGLFSTVTRRRDYKQSKAAYVLALGAECVPAVYPEILVEHAVGRLAAYNNKIQWSRGLQSKLNLHKHGIVMSLSCVTEHAETTVYCLGVETDNAFIANGYAVHNCVSQAQALGLETQSAVRTISDQAFDWVGKVSTELLYIASRIEVGRGALGWSEGSNGAWMVEAAERFGVLPRADYGKGIDVSTYNPKLAKELSSCWRNRPGQGVPNWLEPMMAQNPLRRAVRIDGGFDQAADFVGSGYPILLCSGIGYTLSTDDDGFLLRSRKPWHHAMLLWGTDTVSKRQGGCIANSWGHGWYEVGGHHRHGTPKGCFWADRGNIDLMLESNDCFAIVEFSGPVKRKLSS